MSFNLRALLEEMIEKDASDLHITAGERPKLRIDGDITDSVGDRRPDAQGHASARLLGPHREPEEAVRDRGRARLLLRHPEPGALPRQLFKQRGCVSHGHPADPLQRSRPSRSSGCRRSSPSWPSGRAAWSWSPVRRARASRTTLAAMIDKINKERKGHIITVEDPIEFIHRHQTLHRQPARGRHRHQELRQRAQVRAA